LWLKLNFMGMQGAQDFAPFIDMVQKQMGWNSEMANRVIEEYRKFLFLAMRAGHQVIPPGAVNDVWMLHMQNAQNYWESLGRMITEKPVAGGFDPKAFTAMSDPWAATLQSYERIFGMKPPMDIWGQTARQSNPWEQITQNFRKMWGLE
jgi:hypothetical protein